MKQQLMATMRYVVCASLVACGGDGDQRIADVNNGGGTIIDGSGIAAPTQIITGPIDAFGSVIIDGVRYTTEDVAVFNRGAASTEASLHVGDFITLLAETDAVTGQKSARVIYHEPPVSGVITAINVDDQEVMVLDQRISITHETIFDGQFADRSIQGLAVGDVIEISGASDESGAVFATRVASGVAGLQNLSGVVQKLEPSLQQFMLAGIWVDYSQANLGTEALRNGDLVSVSGQFNKLQQRLMATQVRERDDHRFEYEGEPVHKEGLPFMVFGVVYDYDVGQSFSVAGKQVLLTDKTRYIGGNKASLGSNVLVAVSGELDAQKNILAREITFKQLAKVRLRAEVERVEITQLNPVNKLETGLIYLADEHVNDIVAVTETTKLVGIGPDFVQGRLKLSDIKPQDEVTVTGEYAQDKLVATVIEVFRLPVKLFPSKASKDSMPHE